MAQNKCLICGSSENLQKTPESSNSKPEFMCKICIQMNEGFDVLEHSGSPSIADSLFKKDS